MTNPKVAKVVIGLPVEGPFDYAIDSSIDRPVKAGQRVRVLFNRRVCVGYVVGTASSSAFEKLNPILAVLECEPVLTENDLKFVKMFSDYYGCSFGEGIETFLPPALRRKKSLEEGIPFKNTVRSGIFDTKKILICDLTRHKRWPFIIEHARGVVDNGGSVIVLVPDLSYIKETSAALKEVFCESAVVLDKKLTTKKELSQWAQIRQGVYSVVVGTRSAVFAPVTNLGLIIVIEDDDASYKQEQTPHYHAVSTALMRAQVEGCGVMVAGSSPSAEIWEQARKDQWDKMVMAGEGHVTMQVVDMNNYNPGKTSIFSFPLQNAIKAALDKKENVIIYMNRRGFSTRTSCQKCGWTMKCPRCNVNLSYLYSKNVMVCRHCSNKQTLPEICPGCHTSSYLKSTGRGVEKLESDAARLFPYARIHRYDRETDVFPQGADIVITTQAIFRQRGNWTASLAAILDFDDQMHHIDFRAGQKAFALLIHLRQMTRDKMIIQTRMPDSYSIKTAKDMNYDSFYCQELKFRKELKLPPYRNLVELGVRGLNEKAVLEVSQTLFEVLENDAPKGMEIFEPHAHVNPKLRDQYRFTILLKGRSVESILSHVKPILKSTRKRNIIITINVDP